MIMSERYDELEVSFKDAPKVKGLTINKRMAPLYYKKKEVCGEYVQLIDDVLATGERVFMFRTFEGPNLGKNKDEEDTRHSTAL